MKRKTKIQQSKPIKNNPVKKDTVLFQILQSIAKQIVIKSDAAQKIHGDRKK